MILRCLLVLTIVLLRDFGSEQKTKLWTRRLPVPWTLAIAVFYALGLYKFDSAATVVGMDAESGQLLPRRALVVYSDSEQRAAGFYSTKSHFCAIPEFASTLSLRWVFDAIYEGSSYCCSPCLESMEPYDYQTSAMQSLTAEGSALLLLGRKFGHDKSSEFVLIDEESEHSDSENCSSHVHEFLNHFRSIIWITYRRDFPPFEQTSMSTDAGWGCMIRTGQMILAKALSRQILGEGFVLEKSGPTSKYNDIVSWFVDLPSTGSPYSIHHILQSSQKQGIGAGQWFSPTAIGNCLQELVNKNEDSPIKMTVCRDGSIYKDEVYSLAKGLRGWKPILLYIPLRLGLESLNPVYEPQIAQIFEWPQTLGIVGGRPRASHYFVGLQGDNLLYLDPHTTKPHSDDIAAIIDTFSCKFPSRMPLSSLDPSFAMGFLCSTEDAFLDLCRRIGQIRENAFAAVFEKTPTYAAQAGEGESQSDEGDDEDDEADDFTLV